MGTPFEHLLHTFYPLKNTFHHLENTLWLAGNILQYFRDPFEHLLAIGNTLGPLVEPSHPLGDHSLWIGDTTFPFVDP